MSLTLSDSDHEASVAEEEQRSELKKSCNHEGRWMIAGLACPLEEAEKIVRDSRSTTEVSRVCAEIRVVVGDGQTRCSRHAGDTDERGRQRQG